MESRILTVICAECNAEINKKLFIRHLKWCIKKNDYIKKYNLNREILLSEYEDLHGLFGVAKKYPGLKDKDLRRVFYEMGIFIELRRVTETKCPNCSIEFKDNKNPSTALYKHLLRCNLEREFFKKYDLTPEKLYEEYKKLGSVMEVMNKFPFFPGLHAYYHLFKKYSLDVSIKFSSVHSNIKEKREKTSIERHGTRHNFCKDSKSRKKWESRLLKEEGITNVFQRESVKQKIMETIVEKFGTELWKHALTVRGRGVVSKLNKMVFDILERNNIQFEIEAKILKENHKGYYAYDVLLPGNKIIEVYGDYWHGNPKLYKENDLILKNSSGEIRVGDKWAKDEKKIKFAQGNGFKTLIIWEYDLKNNTDLVIKSILEYAKS